MSATKKKPVETRLEACAKGASIDDLDYDEVTGLMDVIVTRSKAITETGTAKIRELAARIDAAKAHT